MHPVNFQTLGWIPGGALAATNLALSATATWLAMSGFSSRGKTLSKVHAYLAAVNGTLGASDLSCSLYSDTGAGIPNASIQASTTLAGGAPTAAGWITFTGFSTAMTDATPYWLVFKNLNGTPASNFPTFRWSGNGNGPNWTAGWSGLTAQLGWHKVGTTNSGAAWATGVQTNVMGIMLEYSDGTFAGLGYETGSNDTTNGVYSTRKVGAYFTTPANVKYNLAGLVLPILKAGTPTGTARYEIYEDTTLIATSNEIPLASVLTTQANIPALFASPPTLKANTVYRAVLAESAQADSSANAYRVGRFQVGNFAAALAAKPFNGTSKQTYYDGSSWSEADATWVVPVLLLLTEADPFTYNGDSIVAGELKTGVTKSVDGSDVVGTYTGADRWSDPGESNVRDGVTYEADNVAKEGTLVVPAAGDVREGTAVDAGTGTLAVPAASDVRSGVDVDDETGTAAIPAAADVRSGTSVDATVGSLAVPAAANVRNGTAVDNTTGTLVVPTLANTKFGVAGDGGTGLYTGADRWSDPGEANVRDGVAYEANDVAKEGTLDLPVEADVKTGVTFDGASKTGAYTGADRWSDPGEANVLDGVTYEANNVAKEGTLVVGGGGGESTDPGIANVRLGTEYMIDDEELVGTLDLPAEADVALGVDYDNETKTGELDAVTNVMAETELIGVVQPSDLEVTDG